MNKHISRLTASFILCLSILMTGNLNAQIEVSNDNNVGVGEVDANTKLNIRNDLQDKSLRILSNFDTQVLFGIENRIQGASTDQTFGLKNSFLGTGDKVYGVHNFMNKYAALKYGVYNQFVGTASDENIYFDYNILNGTYSNAYGQYTKLVGTSDKAYGNYFQITGNTTDKHGVYSYFSGDTDNIHGIYNYMAPSNNSSYAYGVRNAMHGNKQSGSYGVKKGLDNFMKGNDFDEVYGTTTDIFSNPDNLTVVATKNFVKIKSNGSTFANKNEFQLTPLQTSGNVYGTYNNFNGTGSPYSVVGNYTSYTVTGGNHPYLAYGDFVNIGDGPSFSYGVHSTVPEGSNHYAGYFSGTVYANGDILSPSDLRLKEDVQDLDSALSGLKRLNPKKYKYIKERSLSDQKDHFGFIAQEMKEVYPDLVQLVAQPGKQEEKITRQAQHIEGPDGEIIEIPEEKEIFQKMDGEPMYAINYIGLIPHLVSAIQEQDQKLEDIANEPVAQADLSELVSKIESQEKQIKALESKLEKLMACTNCFDNQIQNGSLESGQTQMNVYPNPANQYFNLEVITEKSGMMELKIFDFSGKLVSEKTLMISIGHNMNQIDLVDWTSGTYLISTRLNGVSQSHKLIVE